jgi:hypothetical protein
MYICRLQMTARFGSVSDLFWMNGKHYSVVRLYDLPTLMVIQTVLWFTARGIQVPGFIHQSPTLSATYSSVQTNFKFSQFFHFNLTIYAPMIYMAPGVMFLMRADTLF